MLAALVAACGGGGGGTTASAPVPATSAIALAASPGASAAPGSTAPPANAALHVPAGFAVSVIATVNGARELAALPNGDLIVGTSGASVAIVPNAEAAGAAGQPATFATLSDQTAQGVAFGGGFVFVATQHGVWRIPYTTGARSGTPQQIAAVRQGPIAPNSDGDVHGTSSVAVSGSTLYVGVGSSCNACSETDPTRASVQRMALDGSGITTQATRMRNAIALATDPTTGTVWLAAPVRTISPPAHPYEFLDPVSSRPAPADYGWPQCEENQHAYTANANCASVVVPALEFPAYSTIIGAAFYPAGMHGTYAFPASWSGGLYVSMHGSWHTSGGVPIVSPHVAFVPFSGSSPLRPVDWSDPTAQWNDFFAGFQNRPGTELEERPV